MVIDPASDHRYRIVDGANLVITAVRRSDAGAYICRARNMYGVKDSQPASLTVLGKIFLSVSFYKQGPS